MTVNLKTSFSIDPELAPLLAAERRRLADQAGLRNISLAACLNAVLRRALGPVEARDHG